jgi:hypothetical protein
LKHINNGGRIIPIASCVGERDMTLGLARKIVAVLRLSEEAPKRAATKPWTLFIDRIPGYAYILLTGV